MKRVLIVGGVAGGASAAARIRRLDESAQITVFEKGPHVSFSNCALPYYLSGIVAKSEKLIMVSPEEFLTKYNIDVRNMQEVTAINKDQKTVTVKKVDTGETYEESYDVLILSPGANPIVPGSIEGTKEPNVFTVRNVEDIARLKAYTDGVDDVAVIGGGFIGVEVAENLSLSGKNVSVIEAADQIMAPFDYDMVQILHKEMVDHGINLVVGDGLSRICPDKVVLSSGKEIKAQAVVLAIGVSPDVSLAKAAGLEIGETGGIKVDHDYRTSDPSIYAVGDAIEVTNFQTQKSMRLALAGPAQKQARACADGINQIPHNGKGYIGSSVVKIFDLNAASTGMNEKTAGAAGISYDFVYIMPFDKPSLMPEAKVMHFKLLFEVPSGKIIGAQAIGKGSVDKRIDVIATMIKMGGTLEDLKELELCYSPMFSTAKDVVNQAALVALNILYGRYKQVPVSKTRELVESDALIIDVREEGEFNNGHLKNAINIPLSQFRSRMSEIPKDKPVYLHCRSSQRSYNAVMALINSGYDKEKVFNMSGSFLGVCLYEYYNDITKGREKIVTEYNFR